MKAFDLIIANCVLVNRKNLHQFVIVKISKISVQVNILGVRLVEYDFITVTISL